MKGLIALLGVLGALLLPLPGVAQPTPPAIAEPIYHLAPDDKIKIVVYGEEALTGDYVIGSDGNLSFPLIGMVKANGLTLAELQSEITRRLDSDFINNPRVNAEIVEYRPFYILGEVNKPGQYTYRVGLTVRAAVATAGGFTYRANQKKIAIQRRGEAGETKQQITPDLQIQPGDTIRVLERFF